MLCLHKKGECMTKLGVLFGVLTGQWTHHNQRTGPFVNPLLLPPQSPHTSESTCWNSVSLNNMFTRAVILRWLQRLSIAIYPSVLKNHPIGLFRNRISKIQEAAPECNNRAILLHLDTYNFRQPKQSLSEKVLFLAEKKKINLIIRDVSPILIVVKYSALSTELLWMSIYELFTLLR